MMLEYTVHAAAAGVRALGPVANQTTVVGSGVESHASFAPIGARMAERALDEAAVAIATELVVAMRALRIRGTEPSGMPACELYERAAAAVLDSDLEDRPLAEDVEAARRLLLEDAGARTAEAAVRGRSSFEGVSAAPQTGIVEPFRFEDGALLSSTSVRCRPRSAGSAARPGPGRRLHPHAGGPGRAGDRHRRGLRDGARR